MSYCGRVEARVLWESGAIEDCELNFMPQRGYRGDPIIEDGYLAEEFFSDMLRGRTDGIYDIAGRYFESFSQDYWGEWDVENWLEGEKARFRSALVWRPGRW